MKAGRVLATPCWQVMLERAGGSSAMSLQLMAQQTNGSGSGCAIGCGTVLLLGMVLAYWPVFLAIALVAVLLYAITVPGLQQKRRELQTLVSAADRRFRHDPCRVGDCFGVVESITLAGDLTTPQIDILCRLITGSGQQLQGEERRISLSPPARLQQLRSGEGAAAWLRSGGITPLAELSVEAKATRAAMECLRERAWTSDALGKLNGLRAAVIDTLAKARGNELLEPSIPQLQQALGAFELERRKLEQAHHSAGEMLRKLHDFLGVPDGIRPILTFDLDQLFDPQRFRALEQSFEEVVLLNDAFRELSRDALA
jgi:hypothetical protein